MRERYRKWKSIKGEIHEFIAINPRRVKSSRCCQIYRRCTVHVLRTSFQRSWLSKKDSSQPRLHRLPDCRARGVGWEEETCHSATREKSSNRDHWQSLATSPAIRSPRYLYEEAALPMDYRHISGRPRWFPKFLNDSMRSRPIENSHRPRNCWSRPYYRYLRCHRMLAPVECDFPNKIRYSSKCVVYLREDLYAWIESKKTNPYGAPRT